MIIKFWCVKKFNILHTNLVFKFFTIVFIQSMFVRVFTKEQIYERWVLTNNLQTEVISIETREQVRFAPLIYKRCSWRSKVVNKRQKGKCYTFLKVYYRTKWQERRHSTVLVWNKYPLNISRDPKNGWK